MLYEAKTGISKRTETIILAMIIMASVCLAIYFGYRKAGMYIDEDYTYTISNGTQLGIAIENGNWNDTAPFMDQLISEGNENFRFSQMYENTANDVHPPLYYIPVHLISSIFSGVFSKWIGLSVNILILIPTLIFVYRLAFLLAGKNSLAALVTTAFYGLSSATMSNAVYIRMYMMLSLWTVIYAYVHVKALDDEAEGEAKLSFRRFLLPLLIVGFCGFLTQYFFVVIMFFISFVYAFYLLVFCGRVKDTFIYGFTALMSLVSTAAVWRSSKFHIFDGYRGKGAVEQLFSFHEYAKRLMTYTGYMNRQIFGGLLPLYAVLFAIGNVLIVITIIKLRKDGVKRAIASLPVYVKGMVLLEIAAILDFTVLAQIGIFAPPESCRFLFQAYSIFLILVPVGTIGIARKLMSSNAKLSGASLFVSISVLIVSTCIGFATDQVLFLYESERSAMEWIDDHPDVPLVLFQNDDGNYDTCIPAYIKYPSIYVASVNEPDSIINDRISNTDELLVYVSTGVEDAQACIDSIIKENPNITKADHVWNSYGWFDVYHMY
ncbi:MAG: hypothetical protein IKO16_09160 [Lachnospiraceae bacterium]|nr:hypothetical protein [Lachnospiraceae bacterium]